MFPNSDFRASVTHTVPSANKAVSLCIKCQVYTITENLQLRTITGTHTLSYYIVYTVWAAKDFIRLIWLLQDRLKLPRSRWGGEYRCQATVLGTNIKRLARLKENI